MKSELDLLPLPINFREYRDSLRVVGYDLVHYTEAHAQEEAARYRHQTKDYEYAIHKIRFIEVTSGQIFIDEHGFYSSEQCVSDWTKHFVEEEQPMGFGIFKQWFSDPARAFITLIVPPYGITLLALTALGDRRDRLEQGERKRALGQLSEMPKFRR